MNYDDVFKQCIATYGGDAQIDMCLEELSELTKALLKYRRKVALVKGEEVTPVSDGVNLDKARAAVIDELADVEIMCRQMELLFEAENEVNDRIQFKVDRQVKRLGSSGSDMLLNDMLKCIIVVFECYDQFKICNDPKIREVLLETLQSNLAEYIQDFTSIICILCDTEESNEDELINMFYSMYTVDGSLIPWISLLSWWVGGRPDYVDRDALLQMLLISLGSYRRQGIELEHVCSMLLANKQYETKSGGL